MSQQYARIKHVNPTHFDARQYGRNGLRIKKARAYVVGKRSPVRPADVDGILALDRAVDEAVAGIDKTEAEIARLREIEVAAIEDAIRRFEESEERYKPMRDEAEGLVEKARMAVRARLYACGVLTARYQDNMLTRLRNGWRPLR